MAAQGKHARADAVARDERDSAHDAAGEPGFRGLREARRKTTILAISVAAIVAFAVLAVVVALGGASSVKIGEEAEGDVLAVVDQPVSQSHAAGDATQAAPVEADESQSLDVLSALDALELIGSDEAPAGNGERALWRAAWEFDGDETGGGTLQATACSASEFPAVDAALAAYADAGYDASFVLYHVESGATLGYNLDRTYFCASTVKAPFVAYLLEDLIDTGAEPSDEVLVEAEAVPGTGTMATDGVSSYALIDVIERTITQSDNTGYRMLWRRYGGAGFDAWAARVGVPEGTIEGAEFPSLSARNLARLWVGVASYLERDSSGSEQLGGFLAATEHSFLRFAASDDAAVASKPGFETNTWYPGDPFDYGALHDAGVIADGAGTWLVVVMSNADYDSDCETCNEHLVEDLIAALLDARAALAGA